MKRSLAFAILMLAGCTSSVLEDPTQDASSTTGTSASTGATAADTTGGSTEGLSQGTTTAGPGSSSTGDPAWETEGADEGYATTGNCGFTCPPPPGPSGGGGNPIECSVSEQDCAEGEKCAPWANDGGGVWTALRCVPIDPEPGALGEACFVEGSFVSGVDSCQLGLFCTPSNPDSLRSNDGACAALCNAGPCDEGTICVTPGTINVGACGEICDPLAVDACPGAQACLPAGLGFGCHFVEDPGGGGPCGATAECSAGELCMDVAQCNEGRGETCCARFCDLEAPDCPDGQACADYGSPLSAYSTVGFCEG